MRKIKINGREIEADDETIRWLVFDIGSQIVENVQTQKTKQDPQKKYCVVCKREITEAGRWKFCSIECYQKHYEGKSFMTIKEKVTQINTKEKKVCKYCGKPLEKRQRKICGGDECFRKLKNDLMHEWKNKKNKGSKKCVICGKALPKNKKKLCSYQCTRKRNNQYVRAWFIKKKAQQPTETPQKTMDLGSEGEGKGWKHTPEPTKEEKFNEKYKETRRKFILEVADKLCRYSGHSYDRAHAMATLQWEALQMKQKNLTPELRLLQSLALGEIGVITGIQLQMIDPDRKFSDFATWVALHEKDIKEKLGITGHFIISNGYIRYQKN